MPDLPGFPGLFQNREGLDQDLSLPFPVSDLTNRPPVGIFDRGRSRNTHRPVEFMGRGEDDRREARFLQESRSQPNGLAAEGSRGREENCFRSFELHVFGNGFDGLLQKIGVLPLEAIKGIGSRSQMADDPLLLKFRHPG